MNTPNDGGPAIPVPCTSHNGELHWGDGGASMRDYFAAHESLSQFDHPEVDVPDSLANVLANRPRPFPWSTSSLAEYLENLRWEAEWRAALKYLRADAMLKAREKKQ